MTWSRTRNSISWHDRISTAPVRWSSSVRPLSVRTVWVEGVRHAILSLDDPLIQYQNQSYGHRPSSSSTSSVSDSSSSSSTTSNELDECLLKLRVALNSAEKINLPPIELSPVHSPTCADPSLCLSPPSLLPQNPLSERVLQWLDLASKGHSLPQPLSIKRPRNVSTSKSAYARRKLLSRSASIDVNGSVQRKKSLPLSTASVPCVSTSEPSVEAQPPLCKNKAEQNPPNQTTTVVSQKYEPLRPLTAWPSAAKSNRPQLHIFMPSVQQDVKYNDFPDDFCCS